MTGRSKMSGMLHEMTPNRMLSNVKVFSKQAN